MASLFWGNSYFDDAIAKATSELLPGAQEDVAANLEICDQIRSKQVQPKDAMRSLKKRVNHTNPNVQLLSLSLIDTCVKNGGDHFLVEIASREFMDNLASIIRVPAVNNDVKQKTLRLIQNWAIAFEGKPTLAYVPTLYKSLKNEGFTFPPYDPVAANAAMVDSQTAPEWIDSDVCLRCRTEFTMINRKHHCRNCGQVFDQQCSSKTMPLPHFGIVEPVRVCDTCHAKLNKAKKETKPKEHHHRSYSLGARRGGREDSDLQRAIQLSLQESGSLPTGGHYRPGYVPAQPVQWQTSEPPLVNYRTRPQAQPEDDDPELRAAIEASLRESNAPKASAPIPLETPTEERRPTMTLPDYDLHPHESDAIMTFNQVVDDAQAQGGDFSRHPGVNQLYERASGLRPKLALSLDDTGRKEQLLSEMHDKLSQAVKLYDNLLSEQLARPSWRAAPSQPYGPTRSATVESYQPQYGYASPPPMSAQPQHMSTMQQQQQQQPYSPVPPEPIRAPSWSQQQPEPAAPQWQSPMPVSQPSYLSAPPPPQPSAYSPQPSAYSPQPAYQAPPPPPQQTPAPYMNGPSPPQPIYAATSPGSAPLVQSPATYNAPQQLPSPARAPGLSRHNTLQAQPTRQPPYQQQQQRPTSMIAPPSQSPLPVFPTAPSSNPQQYSINMFSAPQGLIEQTEKKEAPLISFD